MQVADLIGLKHFGRKMSFFGKIETVKCYENNSFLRDEKHGNGKVLVVDGGGSLRCALLGDNIAALAHKNQWNGILIHGGIRDSALVSSIEIGIVGLGTNPRKSAKRNTGIAHMRVHFAGIDFIPGNLIYNDQDGIVTSEREVTL